MPLEQKVVKSLIDTKKTLAIAESCTGGLLSHKLTNIPGSSQCFKIGVITYSNEAKIKVLGVPQRFIKRFGAVSKETALAMAKKVRSKLKCDYAISITGIAGPTGASENKPIGLVFIACISPQENICSKYLFKGDRQSIKKQSVNQALKQFLELINE